MIGVGVFLFALDNSVHPQDWKPHLNEVQVFLKILNIRVKVYSKYKIYTEF